MLDIDYRETVVSDLLEQFRGRPNNMVLVESYAVQFQEVYEVLMSLLTMLDIDKCTGHQLDILGDIVVFSRYDARVLVGKNQDGEILNDDLYRKFIKYKILLNTNDCTYWSIMQGIKMFWKNPLHYTEDSRYPATMVLETEPLTSDEDISALLTAPIPRPGGVGIVYRMKYRPKKCNIYVGFAVQIGKKVTVECEIPTSLDITSLTEESGNLLSDENGVRIIDEEG